MLFCRGPRHLTAPAVRGRRPGGITLWGRRATRRSRPRWAPHAVGTHRTWRTHPGGTTQVTRTAVYAAAGPGRPGGWATTSWVPTPVRPGVTLPLRWCPVGTVVGRVGWAARAHPGRVLRHRPGRVELRLGSRRTVWFDAAVLGVVGHRGVRARRPARAGDAHRAGRRPTVRGVAMNPVDHPHGGGQGKTSGGRPGTTPWGRLTRGVRTAR